MRKVVFTLFAALSACFIWTGCGPELNFDEGDDTGALYYTSETAVQFRVQSIYLSTARFLGTQLRVESYICNGDWWRLDSYSIDIYNLWKEGYDVVYTTNLFIQDLLAVKDADIDYYKGQYITHLRVLRDFVLYNMSHLWGGIPLPTENGIPSETLPRTKDELVYLYILDDLSDVLKEINTHPTGRWDAGKGSVSERVVYMLMAECHLAWKNWSSAGECVNLAANNDTEFFILDGIPVYSKSKASLYSKEAAGEIRDLAASWDETFLHAYGYWAALKRLGIAQQKVHCEEHQLLLPIPYEVLMLNDKLTQNPGYN